MEKNMSLKKTPMPCLIANERNKVFDEVALGYTEEMAVIEAKRCLECKNRPCISRCPVNINIPEFIKFVAQKDFDKAYEVLSKTTSLAAICGRVCPQERQCESACVRGIKGEPVAIGRLERFVADYYRANKKALVNNLKTNGKKVAIIGAGPAGLSAAGDLAKLGYEVTIFEALHEAGGVLFYGIPEFRLPKSIVKSEIENLKALGVKIETNMVIGKILTIDELFDMGFKAVFVGTGAGLPSFMGIKGENLCGVYSANEYLTRINLMQAYKNGSKTPIISAKKVAVVGGGNVAMDAARCAKRLGAENVYIIYRRSENELPARKEEVEHAKEEGIEFKFLSNPKEIIGDESGFVKAIKCVKMELSDIDQSGRKKPVEIKDSDFLIDINAVIMAIGTQPNKLIRETTPGLNVNQIGCIIVKDESGITSRDGVYAGGDAVTGAATAILAMGAGKNAAKAIDKYLSKV